MDNNDIHLVIAIAIIFIGYFILKKVYNFWMKVGYHVMKGLFLVYKTKKQTESIFSLIKDWYNNRTIFCRICNASGVISECCNAQLKNIRVKEKENGYEIIKRRTQCLQCGALCNPIKCYCRK